MSRRACPRWDAAEALDASQGTCLDSEERTPQVAFVHGRDSQPLQTAHWVGWHLAREGQTASISLLHMGMLAALANKITAALLHV